jgi:hypothetical protein
MELTPDQQYQAILAPESEDLESYESDVISMEEDSSEVPPTVEVEEFPMELDVDDGDVFAVHEVIDLTGDSEEPEAGPEMDHRALAEGREVEGPAGDAPAPRFRLAVKKIACTWAQCDVAPEVALQNILTHFSEDRIKWALICKELHQDGQPHLHAGIWLKFTPDYRSSGCLDFVTGQHGEYKKMSDPPGWIKYIMKDRGEHAAFGIKPEDYLEARRKRVAVGFQEVATQVAEGATVLTLLREEKYRGFLMQHLTKVKAYASAMLSLGQDDVVAWRPVPLPLEYPNPTEAQGEVVDWLNTNLFQERTFGATLPDGSPRFQPLMIIGPTAHGKSTLAHALSRFCRIYHLPMDEPFYDLYQDDAYDLVIIEEYRNQKTIQFMNAFVDGLPLTLRQKGAQYVKRRNLPVIMLTNYEPDQQYVRESGEDPAGFAAYVRRWKIVRVGKALLAPQGEVPQRDDLFALASHLLTHQ